MIQGSYSSGYKKFYPLGYKASFCFFNPEAGRDILFWNGGWPYVDYKALYLRQYNSSELTSFLKTPSDIHILCVMKYYNTVQQFNSSYIDHPIWLKHRHSAYRIIYKMLHLQAYIMHIMFAVVHRRTWKEGISETQKWCVCVATL
jgi:hypothetical protein